MKYALLAVIYLFVLFMAWSAFGGLGIAYVLIVPVPLVLFSYITRKNKIKGKQSINPRLSWWTSPIPYLSLILLGFIGYHLIF